MKQIIIILAIPLLFTGCKKLFEPYDERTYYKENGVGYVFYDETKEPVQNAKITVVSHFRDNGWATVHPINEYYFSDISGYFCIKFLKRTKREDVICSKISANKDNYKYRLNVDILPYFTAEDLQHAKDNIQIDTLWLEYNPYWNE